MNVRSIQFSFVLFLTLASRGVVAQDTRTVATRVTDVVALLPAKDNTVAKHLFDELIQLGDEGLGLVTDGVRKSGDPQGVPSRYAVSLLTHYTTTPGEKARIEGAYLKALSKASDPELKTYFIENLKLVGSGQSVPALAKTIQEPALAEAGISALEAIGTPEACEVLRNFLPGASAQSQERTIKALGAMRDAGSLSLITTFTKSDNVALKKQALWSIALVADASSVTMLLESAGFSIGVPRTRPDGAESMVALLEYMQRLRSQGNSLTATSVQAAILDNTLAPVQQHYRLAALKNLVITSPGESQKFLTKELNRFDDQYRREVLKVAKLGIDNDVAFNGWTRLYPKSKGEVQAEILVMLAEGHRDDAFAERFLLPALASSNAAVRLAGVRGVAANRNKKFTDALVNFLVKSTSDAEIKEAQKAILQIADQQQIEAMAKKIGSSVPGVQVAMIQILASRSDVNDFDVVAQLTNSPQPVVRAAAFQALPSLASPGSLKPLLTLLESTNSDEEIKQVQSALVAIIDKDSGPLIDKVFVLQKLKLIPVLPYVPDPGSLDRVKTSFEAGTVREKELAFEALTNWQNSDATSTLLSIRRDEKLSANHGKVFQAYVRQVMASNWPDDQKLLRLREIIPLASTAEEKKSVIWAAGGVRTFLSLMFVAPYLDDATLSSTASRSTMRIALPTADAQPGLSGDEVKKVLEKVTSTLTGEDSQYDRIDVKTYLDNLSHAQGFKPLFNGIDLSGWKGLVENPIARAKMTKAALAEKQAEADKKISQSWSVKEGMICFTGEGANLCTNRSYADFEMLVDWKISKNGDSGIYLRGTPQVQIWDISRVADGAHVGSGGLYNNTSNRIPLVVADNAIGDWNTLRITMIGDRVTVYLNGLLVVDNAVMENYWDRKIPIFPDGAIELQAHGTELAFRNIYVRELNQPYQLSMEEKGQGFEVLFNGQDLSNWVGNKTDYVVEDHCIAIYPTKAGHGNLYTEKEFSDFIYRFEFQLTPGSNNGLGIHAPLEGDAAYMGKELQILDDTNPAYANIQPWQAHGSVYGIIPAKRGYLKPAGEWNYEEVQVIGDKITITLNGNVIVDGDVKKASQKGTLDHQDHPGLNRHRGHIGFLGHGSVVKFKNIRIKNLEK